VAIILLTVLIKAVFFKLSATSYKLDGQHAPGQPKLQDIREQHADDKQKQSQAMMELYRKEKINPMGGCLPILVQMPVFIALYWVLHGERGAAPRALHAVDRRPVRDGPLLRPAPDDGCEHVVHAETEPAAAGSDAGQDHAVVARGLHLLLPLVPGRSGPVLGSEQPACPWRSST
jgi:YidC/Oxa1 family membrane protein insertase